MTLEVFSPHVGERFLASLEADGAPVASLVLIEAERSPRADAGGRPFRLLFEGLSQPSLEQRNYWIAREGDAPQEIFLVPIAPGRYEAVFN